MARRNLPKCLYLNIISKNIPLSSALRVNSSDPERNRDREWKAPNEPTLNSDHFQVLLDLFTQTSRLELVRPDDKYGESFT